VKFVETLKVNIFLVSSINIQILYVIILVVNYINVARK